MLMRFLMACGLCLALALVGVLGVAGFIPSLFWPDRGLGTDGYVPNPENGAYLFRVGGCASCHTAPGKGAKPLAGGRVLKTVFGNISVPNITPDREAGIGAWSAEDFLRAMRLGLSPSGRHYYPAFPYNSYTNMSRDDLLDIWTHLKTIAPVADKAPTVTLDFPFNIRAGLGLWKLLFLVEGEGKLARNQDEGAARGAYLVKGPGHCAECHTPRNALGGWKYSRWLSGSDGGPNPVPGIAPARGRGLKGWNASDISFALKTGMLPDGDSVGSEMATVVDKNLSKLTDEDAAAMAAYLLSARR